MTRMLRGLPLALGLLSQLLMGSAASALPMSYEGSTTVGLEIDPIWSSASFSHALRRQHGLGLSAQLLPGGDGSGGHHASQATSNESFVLVDSTYLIKRWNLPKAQGNLWLFAGVGTYQAWGGSDPNALRIAARPGLQFDIENTRLRLEGKAQAFLAPGIERSLFSATTGVGLTPPRYQGIQPWLELQVRAMPGLVDQLEFIPKLRLLHQRVVLDIGYSNLGSVVGSVTTTF